MQQIKLTGLLWLAMNLHIWLRPGLKTELNLETLIASGWQLKTHKVGLSGPQLLQFWQLMCLLRHILQL